MPYYDLAFNLPLGQVYTYKEDSKGEAQVGKRAMAILGKKDCLAYIVAQRETPPPGLKEEAIKPIRRLVDSQVIFGQEDLDLARWLAQFYFCSLGEALGAMIPSGKRAGTYPSLIEEEDITDERLDLSDEQKQALEEILKPEAQGKRFYLYGITGSGKTEVFLRAAQAMLERGRSVIYLVPEISLTHQTAETIGRRFGGAASAIHSGMSPAERFSEWMKIRGSEEARIVVGPRSAVFAPVKNLGLNIIDEEQDGSYKSGASPRYHARQVAMRRTSPPEAPAPGGPPPGDRPILLMGSATPSAEAWQYMEDKTITRLSLSRRLSGGDLPEVIPVSLEKTEGALSPELKEEIRITAGMGKQSILFLNRRGFAYYYHCKSCLYELSCRRCSVSLTWYKSRNRAICHYCGYTAPVPQSCPQCGSLEAGFSGFGTEMIEEEIRATFPELSYIRVDGDTMKNKRSLKKALESFRAGEIDILLGTQMVAKGLNFPGVRLVGVVLADTGLHLPDFRAAERTFALVVQVAGRSGRYTQGGKVIVQTLRPQDPAIVKSCTLDLPGFYEEELAQRRELGFPPFTRLIRLVLRGRQEDKVIGAAQRLADLSRPLIPPGAETLGPAECPLALISGQYRRQLILRGRNMGPLHRSAQAIIGAYMKGRDPRVHMEIDVDPVNLL
ncbi:MAG: primosomal protein N' [Treponema sp.]|nr:primosomal protein N' [Treponema sp.]